VPRLSPGVDLVHDELRLRPLVQADAADVARLRRDEETIRWAHPDGCTVEDARRAIKAAEDARRNGEGISLAVVSRDSGALIGTVAVTFYGPRRAGIGYDVAREERGRGVATRALTAVSRWAFETFADLVRLELWILPGNDPSIRVAERVGFKREGVFRSRLEFGGELRDVVVFSLLRGEHETGERTVGAGR